MASPSPPSAVPTPTAHPAYPTADFLHAVVRALALPRDAAFEEALRQALRTFVEHGWRQATQYRATQLPPHLPAERQLLQRLIDHTRDDIARAWQDHSPETLDDPWLLPAHLKAVAERAGERVVALRLAGESAAVIQSAQVILRDQVEAAFVISLLRRMRTELGLQDVAELAVVLAAVARAESVEPPADPMQQMEDDRLISSLTTPVRRATLAALVGRVRAGLRGAREQFGDVVGFYHLASAELFRQQRLADARTDPALDAPGGPVDTRPPAGIQTLIAFETSSRDGTSVDARVLSAHEIFARTVAALKAQRGTGGVALRGEAVLSAALQAIQRLGRILGAERACHKDVKRTWIEIEEKLKMEHQKDPETTIYPVVEKYGALETRALYYQDAISKGIPLGVILSELYDSTTLTFGPTERQYFERVACYAARKYAANFVADADERLHHLSDAPARVADLQMVLRQVEADLRRDAGTLDDATLRHRVDELLDRAVADGLLRRRELAMLQGGATPGEEEERDEDPTLFPYGLGEEMITRIRAAQEVRAITALLAVHGHVPDDLVRHYMDLPHTARYATLQTPSTRLARIRARNGQTLHDLERVTRARWSRYRQQAPAGRDVETVAVPTASAEPGRSPVGEVHGKAPFGAGKKNFGPKPAVARPAPVFTAPTAQRREPLRQGR